VTTTRVGLLQRLVIHHGRASSARWRSRSSCGSSSRPTPRPPPSGALLVPIVVEGSRRRAGGGRAAAVAEVTVSGRRRASTAAARELRGRARPVGRVGDFQVQVASWRRRRASCSSAWCPSEVIGIVETVARAEVPVVATCWATSARPARLVTVAPARPRSAAARRSWRVVAVVVPLPAADALAATAADGAGYAVDAQRPPAAGRGGRPRAFGDSAGTSSGGSSARVPAGGGAPTADRVGAGGRAEHDVASSAGPASAVATIARAWSWPTSTCRRARRERAGILAR
jgi:hypothetical protein